MSTGSSDGCREEAGDPAAPIVDHPGSPMGRRSRGMPCHEPIPMRFAAMDTGRPPFHEACRPAGLRRNRYCAECGCPVQCASPIAPYRASHSCSRHGQSRWGCLACSRFTAARRVGAVLATFQFVDRTQGVMSKSSLIQHHSTMCAGSNLVVASLASSHALSA